MVDKLFGSAGNLTLVLNSIKMHTICFFSGKCTTSPFQILDSFSCYVHIKYWKIFSPFSALFLLYFLLPLERRGRGVDIYQNPPEDFPPGGARTLTEDLVGLSPAEAADAAATALGVVSGSGCAVRST